MKFKYGAWYLEPTTWKKRGAEEPLQDPKEIKDQEMSEAKKKSNALVGRGCNVMNVDKKLDLYMGRGVWE